MTQEHGHHMSAKGAMAVEQDNRLGVALHEMLLDPRLQRWLIAHD